jgi:hypothetical protein
LKVTPVGNRPDSESLGAGNPVIVTVNDAGMPTPNVVLVALVIAGGVVTVSKKFCVSFGRTPFCADKVIGKIPLVEGVPPRTPVTMSNVTPIGNAPVSVKVAAGKPLAVTVNVLDVPSMNVTFSALTISGASLDGAK